MVKQKSILFLIRKPPLLSDLPAAAMDILLTAAAFEQPVTLVFSGDGVLQLLRDQGKGRDGMKNISQALPALELYDVNRIMAAEEALREKGLTEDDLVVPVTAVAREELASLLDESDLVFNI